MVALAPEPIAIVSVPVAVAPLIASVVLPSTAISPRPAVAAYALLAPKRATEITVNLRTVAIPFLPDSADTSVLFCSADDERLNRTVPNDFKYLIHYCVFLFL